MATTDSKKDEGKEGEEQAAPPPKSKKKLFIIIGAIAAVVVIALVAVLAGGGKKAAAKATEQATETQRHYGLAEFPPIIVNLSDSSSYLKVTLQLEYDEDVIAEMEAAKHGTKGQGEGGGGAGGEGKKESAGGGLPHMILKREPMIKDAIIRVLSSKKVEELLTSDGKEKLKEELVEAINEAIGLEESPIVNIYFTEFIIQ
jgi:flagellar protein FliL